MASIAAGRGWSAAGQGLGSIGQLLFGVARQKQAEEQRLAEKDSEWERGAPEREARMAELLARSNLREGPVPEVETMGEFAPVAGAGGAWLPSVESAPSPDYEQVTPGFHRMTPEAEARQAAALQRRLQEERAGSIAGDVSAFLENPRDARAIGGVVAAGMNPGTLRDATSPRPQAPVPGTPEYYEYLRKVKAIESEGDGTGDSYSDQLRLQSVLMTGKALSELQQYRDETPEQFQARREAFLRTRGFQDMTEFQRQMRKALGVGGGVEAPAPAGGPSATGDTGSMLFPGSPSFMDMAQSRFNASGSSGGSGEGAFRLTARDRLAQLVQQGRSRDEARRIMEQEGYF